MWVGVFLSVLQVEFILWRSCLGWWLGTCSGMGVFMQEVSAWNCCHREMSFPGQRFPPRSPLLRGSAWITLLEESIWSLAWRKVCFPCILGRVFCCLSSVRSGLACSSCEGEQCEGRRGLRCARQLQHRHLLGLRVGAPLLPGLSCGSWTPIATIFPCHNSQSLDFFLVLLLKLGDDTC